MKVDFKKQNVHTFEIFYESTGLTEANFLRPLAKLCVQDAGGTPKKITATCTVVVLKHEKSLLKVKNVKKVKTSLILKMRKSEKKIIEGFC